jgi:hypothetical protein
MITQLTEANRADFLSRFHQCDDGVIQRMFLDLAKGNFHYVVTVILHAYDTLSPDPESPRGTDLVEIKLVFEQVEEYVIRHGHGGFIQVLSGGISILFDNNLLYFDFTWDTTTTIEAMRKSDFYFAAKSASWEIIRPIKY